MDDLIDKIDAELSGMELPRWLEVVLGSAMFLTTVVFWILLKVFRRI